MSLASLLLCPSCSEALAFDAQGRRVCCSVRGGSVIEDGVVEYGSDVSVQAAAEMRARDRQASGYMSHGKFPTQKSRLREFVLRAAHSNPGRIVLDLGCGPGPTTAILSEFGFRGVAVDVSGESLRRNRDAVGDRGRFLYARADLTRIRFAPQRADGLMMADFLQHLGSQEEQSRFLREAFAALAPGGWFYLSFFNLNLVNRLKRDVSGGFSAGDIRYRRMTPADARGLLPECALVTHDFPMNIFQAAAADHWAARLPLARHFARMYVLCGRKAGGADRPA